MVKLRLEVQEIFDSMAVGLVASVTGKTYVKSYGSAVSIDVTKNQYTFDLFMYAGEGRAYKFLVVVNNDYMRVYNGDNEDVDFTTVTHYFSGARRAVSKEEK